MVCSLNNDILDDLLNNHQTFRTVAVIDHLFGQNMTERVSILWEERGGGYKFRVSCDNSKQLPIRSVGLFPSGSTGCEGI